MRWAVKKRARGGGQELGDGAVAARTAQGRRVAGAALDAGQRDVPPEAQRRGLLVVDPEAVPLERIERSVGSWSSAMRIPSPIAWGTPAGTKTASPALTGTGLQRAEEGVVVLRVDPGAQRVRRDLLAPADGHLRAVARREDDPRLGLAEVQPEVLVRERVVGMVVHGQALAGVQQLDQERGARAEARGVGGAEPPSGSAASASRTRPPSGMRLSPRSLSPKSVGRRADPLLGRVVAADVDPAQLGDRRAAAVEVADRVGRELDRGRRHGAGSSPDPRATTVHSIVRRWGARSSPSRRR